MTTETLGFKRRRDVFTTVIVPGILGWLGLNRATKSTAPAHVEINPVVGVRFEGVEQLVDACRADESNPWITPTISSPIGYLLPESRFTSWFLGPRADPSASENMLRAIVEHGLPFMRSVPDLRTLRRKMDERIGIEHQLVYRRPVAAYLDGAPDRARELLDGSVAALGSRTDLAAEDLRKFAQRLRERLSSARAGKP